MRMSSDRGAGDPLWPLAPVGFAISAAARPSALALGVGAGAGAGALVGLAAGLVYIRSPAAAAVGPLVLLAILVLWPSILGALALIADRAASGAEATTGEALRAAVRRAPALTLAALPVLVALGALLAVQFAAFFLTQPPQATIVTERPVALIASVFVILLLADTVALAGAHAALWMVVPHVMVTGVDAGFAYSNARLRFWERPGWTMVSMSAVLILAGMVTGAALAVPTLALALVSGIQMLGANELVLLHLSAPLVQGSFAVALGNFAAIVILTTGLGGALGGAAGLGHVLGVAGGTGLLHAVDGPRRR